jgi:outer membrane protein OmpA-like peptidoglycan-associated protein
LALVLVGGKEKKMRVKSLIAMAAVVLAPVAGHAGESANAPTVTGETGLFTLFSGDTLPRGEWSFGLYANNWDRLIEAPGEDIGVDWSRLSASVGYGVTDRWEISVMAPYERYDYENDGRFGRIPDQDGLGNIRLGTKFRLTGGMGSDTSLALNAFVEPATGDDEVASDDTGWGVGLDWRLRNWVINVGYQDVGGFGDSKFDSQLLGGIGYAGRVSDQLDWITELQGTFYGDEGFKDAYDLTSGGRLWLGEEREWAFNFALRTDLNQLSSIDDHCPIGGLIGITYSPFGNVRKEEVPPPPPPPAPEPPPAPAPPPAAPEPPPPPPPAAPAPRPEERVTINFTSGSARLSNIAKAKLDEVALRMKQDPELVAQVLGYSDASGAMTANQRMSQQRAQAVKDYLVSRHGIDPSRIMAEGRGSADSTGNAESDRRAVVILTTR